MKKFRDMKRVRDREAKLKAMQDEMMMEKEALEERKKEKLRGRR